MAAVLIWRRLQAISHSHYRVVGPFEGPTTNFPAGSMKDSAHPTEFESLVRSLTFSTANSMPTEIQPFENLASVATLDRCWIRKLSCPIKTLNLLARPTGLEPVFLP